MFVSTAAGSTSSGRTAATASASRRARAWSSASRSSVVVERVPAGGGEDADLPHAAAVPLAPDPGGRDALGGADEHRADRRAEALATGRRTRCRRARRTRRAGRRWRRGRSTAGRRRGGRRCPAPRRPARSARSSSIGCTVPPPKLCVFSTAIAAVETRYGPASGTAIASAAAASSRPRVGGQVRVVTCPSTAWPPSSARTTCASESHSSSWPAGDERADAEHVRHRARRAEQPGLVPEQLGDVRLERVDGRVLAVDVVADLGVGHGLAHAGGGPGDGVGAQVDDRPSTARSRSSRHPTQRSRTQRRLGWRRASAAGEHLRDEERELERLLVVQPRVAERLVAGRRGRPRRSPRRRRGTR